MQLTTKSPLSLVMAMGCLALSAHSANAALSLVNGDFETGGLASGVWDNGSFPVPWYSKNPGGTYGWTEFRNNGAGGFTGTALCVGQGSGYQDGYIYQKVGTYGGEVDMTLDGTAYNRTNNSKFGDFDVSFYFTPSGAFAPAEGTDVAASGTQIGATMIFTEGVNLPGIATGTTPTSSAFSHTVAFAASGISVGDDVWVRLGDGAPVPVGTNFDEPFIDDLSIIATVPEPTTLALLGLGGLALLRRRR